MNSKVKLTREEEVVLLDFEDLPSQVRKYISASHHSPFTLTDDEIILLDDYCGDKILYCGLDENYRENHIGRVLEDLRDKLYKTLEAD